MTDRHYKERFDDETTGIHAARRNAELEEAEWKKEEEEETMNHIECPDKSDWSDAKNDRRCELLDKEIERMLLPAEACELEELQRQMFAYRRKLAPLPLREAQRIKKGESDG